MNRHRAIALLFTLAISATAVAQSSAGNSANLQWPWIYGALAAGVLLILAALAFAMRIGKLEKAVTRSLTRIEETRRDRERPPNEKGKRDDLGQLRNELRGELESLRSIVRSISADTQRLLARNVPEPQSRNAVSAPVSRAATTVMRERDYEEQRPPEDTVAQLLTIANRIVQQSPTTLDAFRASTGAIASRVMAWPSAAEGTPVAFIVEHRGSLYAVPNVGKPARLPQEWFNRSDFGVNDEIQRVVSLPRLRHSGDGYDVQEAGVFAR